MGTAIAKTDSNITALATAQDAWTDARREFVRKNFASGAPDHFVDLFLKLCERRNLSPEAKHIYLVPRKTKNRDGSYSTTWTPQTSIDGQRLIAARTGCYAGSDDAVFLEGDPFPSKASVTVYRVVNGVRCPFTASAYWREYYPGDGPAGTMWRSLPHVMLAKVAESAALRKAFPEDLSGMYTDDEMAQAGSTTEATFREVPTITPSTPQIAPASTETNDAEANESFDGRLADALEMPSEPQKKLFNALYKEAVDEKDTDKLRLLIKFAPTYAQANNILNSATDKHGLNTQAMVDALKHRDDAPAEAEFVDVSTGEIEA